MTSARVGRRRRVIGERLRASVTTKPPVTLHTRCRATGLVAMTRRSGPRVTVTGFVGAVAARVLGDHPAMNAHLAGDTVTTFSHVHLGVAVDTPAGLIVPVVRDANLLVAADLSARIGELAALARAGTIRPDQVVDATFTVSSLGAFGVDAFTPIIDPPQVAVLGVGAVRDEATYEEGTWQVVPMLGLSLTFDHAAVDGAPAARFLADVVRAIEVSTPDAGGAPAVSSPATTRSNP
jgi:pyruvate dehydrogenase E2 component (dihydrolipoamide acetyltransferase)